MHHRPLHLLAVCFCAGLLGALLSGLLLCLAGKFGAFVIFLGLAFGMVGFVAKYMIQWVMNIK